MKHFIVDSDCVTGLLIEAETAHKACIKYLEDLGYTNPRLAPMYVDSKDGNTYQVGYVCGPHWLTVGEVHFMRKLITKEAING